MTFSTELCATILALLSASSSALAENPSPSPSPPGTVKAEAGERKGSSPRKSATTVAVLELASNDPDSQEKARSLGTLVAYRLAERPGVKVTSADQVRAILGLERQKALLGCSDGSCLAEISGALGVRYVLQGRLDKFGKTLVLTAAVLDTRNAQALRRMRQDIVSDDDLPRAVDLIADAAADSIGLPPVARSALGTASGNEPTVPFAPDFHLNVKLGNTLPALAGFSFKGFTLRMDLEGDYYIRPFLLGYLEAGLVLGRTAQKSDDMQGSSFSLVPVSAGIKYLFRHDQTVRPYAGMGLGLGVVAAFVDPQSAGRLGLNVNGLVGLGYFPFRTVGFNLEASLNLASLGVTEGTKVFFGFNTNFGVLVLF